jgi:hypothetical protein
MTTCDKKFLIARCHERGYSLEEVMPCVVRQIDKDLWVIDETHPSYPHSREPKPPECLAGTELKGLLKRVGIIATPTCSCNHRAAHMDNMGCQWVKDNIETVVTWLGEESAKRGLPFVRMAGRALVMAAVTLAERKAHVLPTPEQVHK